MDNLVISRRRFMGVNHQNLHRFLEKCYIFTQSMLHIDPAHQGDCPIMACRCNMPMRDVAEFLMYRRNTIVPVTNFDEDVAHSIRRSRT